MKKEEIIKFLSNNILNAVEVDKEPACLTLPVGLLDVVWLLGEGSHPMAQQSELADQIKKHWKWIRCQPA